MLNARLNRAPLSRAGRLVATAALVLVTTLAAGFSTAQTTTALSGIVTDTLGRVIPNMPVALTDMTTSARHEVRTDGTGHYEFVGLPSGDYMLKVATAGFKTFDERVVLTGATMQRNVVLQLGMIQESITVTDGASSITRPTITREQAQQLAKARKFDDCGAVGGCVAPPAKIADKKPIFPDTYSGSGDVVILKGIIDATGHVSNLQAIGQPNPDLAQAAITAVSQWEFEPTRLDGQVVETEMTVTVNFKSTR